MPKFSSSEPAARIAPSATGSGAAGAPAQAPRDRTASQSAADRRHGMRPLRFTGAAPSRQACHIPAPVPAPSCGGSAPPRKSGSLDHLLLLDKLYQHARLAATGAKSSEGASDMALHFSREEFELRHTRALKAMAARGLD